MEMFHLFLGEFPKILLSYNSGHNYNNLLEYIKNVSCHTWMGRQLV